MSLRQRLDHCRLSTLTEHAQDGVLDVGDDDPAGVGHPDLNTLPDDLEATAGGHQPPSPMDALN